jgi:hypothetical protein
MPVKSDKIEKKEDKEKITDHITIHYANNGLTVNDKGIFYRKGGVDKEIYTKNIAGTVFEDNYWHRILCIVLFGVGLVLLIITAKSSIIQQSTLKTILVILLIITCIVTIVSFFVMRDEIKVYSTSSLLSIRHRIGMKENLSDIQKAIDKAIDDSRKSRIQ